jgi:hypothetical protein
VEVGSEILRVFVEADGKGETMTPPRSLVARSVDLDTDSVG